MPDETGSNKKTLAPAKAPVASTGGQGFRFENQVGARFLLDLLTGRNSLGPEFGRVVRLDWQARDMGVLADDLVVTSRAPDGSERLAGLSIKANKQLTEAGFQADFANNIWRHRLGGGSVLTHTPPNDVIGLVTGDLASTVATAWSSLSREAAETPPERTVSRLAKPVPGAGAQSSAIQRAIFESLKCPAERAASVENEPEQRAALLSAVRVLNPDFQETTSKDAVEAIRQCQECLASHDFQEAGELWKRLVGIADELRPVGGGIDLAGLLTKLRGEFRFEAHPDFRADLDTLERRSQEALGDIRTHIGASASLSRDGRLSELRSLLEYKGGAFLIGESGTGKSALTKRLGAEAYDRLIWFSATDLNHASMVDAESALGLTHPMPEILAALPSRSLIVFDGVESFSEHALKNTAKILTAQGEGSPLPIDAVLTVQAENAGAVMHKLIGFGAPASAFTTIELGRPTRAEQQTLLGQLPALAAIAQGRDISSVLSNLKIFDWAAKLAETGAAIDARAIGTQTGFLDLLWEHWVEGGDNGLERSHLLQLLAEKEADSLTAGVPRRDFAHTAQKSLGEMQADDLIRFRDQRVRLAHDLLGEIARMQILVAEDFIATPVSRERANSPRWHRAIRLFGQHVLEQSENGIALWQDVVENVPEDATTAVLVRDLFLESLFLSTDAASLIEKAWPVLTASGGFLLKRMLDRFLFIATVPHPLVAAIVKDPDDAERASHLLRVPSHLYWGPVIGVLAKNLPDVVRLAPEQVARISNLWLSSTPVEIGGNPAAWRAEAAALAVVLARAIQEDAETDLAYRHVGSSKTAYEALLQASPDLPDEVTELSLELAKRRDLPDGLKAKVAEAKERRRKEMEGVQRPKSIGGYVFGKLRGPWADGPESRVDSKFRQACLDSAAFQALIQTDPDVALEVLLAVCIEEPKRGSHDDHSLQQVRGLAFDGGVEPPAYFRGPFLRFLQLAPEQGLSVILRLASFASEQTTPGKGVEIEFEGQKALWVGDWRTFQWAHDWAVNGAILPSALMALEKWLFDQAESGIDITPAVDRILREGRSLALAGILFSIGKKVPALFEGPLGALLFSWELTELDWKLTAQRRTMKRYLNGYWGNQPQQAIDLASEWLTQPYKIEVLLGPTGLLTRSMLANPAFAPFFERIRSTWRKSIDADGNPSALRFFVERLDPANYTFAEDGTVLDFQWPEPLKSESEAATREHGVTQMLLYAPMQYRKALDEGAEISDNDLPGFWDWLVDFATNPPNVDEERGVTGVAEVVSGGIALVVRTRLSWLKSDTAKFEWAEVQLRDIVENSRPITNTVAVGDYTWDSFVAEAAVDLLADDASNQTARHLVARSVMASRYAVSALTVSRAFVTREALGKEFLRITHLLARWAALRSLQDSESRSYGQEVPPKFTGQEAQLADQFVTGALSADLPDLVELNAEANRGLEEIDQVRFPERKSHKRLRGGHTSGSREVLHPEWPGLDGSLIKGSLAWLDIGQAKTPAERQSWLQLLSGLSTVAMSLIPPVDDPSTHEISSTPGDFEGFVFERIAANIPHLSDAEAAALWQPILDLGPAAHAWVERFFWYWFTNGYNASASPTAFVKMWRPMMVHALDSPTWNAPNGDYRLDDMVIHLMGFNGTWSAVSADAANVPLLESLSGLYARAATQWFGMPDVVRAFLDFVTRPGATRLLLPAIRWLSPVIPGDGNYSWRHGMEDAFVEFLRMCWQLEGPRIASNPELKAAFLDLVSVAVARNSPAAIALRDQIARSQDG